MRFPIILNSTFGAGHLRPHILAPRPCGPPILQTQVPWSVHGKGEMINIQDRKISEYCVTNYAMQFQNIYYMYSTQHPRSWSYKATYLAPKKRWTTPLITGPCGLCGKPLKYMPNQEGDDVWLFATLRSHTKTGSPDHIHDPKPVTWPHYLKGVNLRQRIMFVTDRKSKNPNMVKFDG